MQIQTIEIRNFRSIKQLRFTLLREALILVGRNGVGKTSVLDAVCAALGCYDITQNDFNSAHANIEIYIELAVNQEDLHLLHMEKCVSSYRRYEVWKKDFIKKLPSYNNGVISFCFSANYSGQIRYSDNCNKNNPFIREILPTVYLLDEDRNMEEIQDQILNFSENSMFRQMRSKCCLFDEAKECTYCFSCIGLINQKSPSELSAFETEKLLEYKLYQLNLEGFSEKVTRQYHKNGGAKGNIHYGMCVNTENLFDVRSFITGLTEENEIEPVSFLGKGMRSIYLLSLLEVYLKDRKKFPSIILMEDPEMFLHPALQKRSSEILYRLSKKCQVIFTTHSPNLLFPFNENQIRQMALDSSGRPTLSERTDISSILNNLGQSAEDFLNVGFVFIVEGKQDKNRLPLLLNQYYKEVYDEDHHMRQISIITTNSCTNIKTYANLKYMNQVYLRDRFIMIRDSDGKDPDELSRELCHYYKNRNAEDVDHLPRVSAQNVLILKYYSFENYFLNPDVMTRLGIVSSPDEFYEILFEKWKEYLHRLVSGKHLIKVLGKNLESVDDIKENIESIKIYVRGHNLYDIFYGPYKDRETELLSNYLKLAPKSDFQDIFDKINNFPYFDNRRKCQ